MEKEQFSPGVYRITNERYHASAGVSRSALWTFKQLPHKYWYEYLSGQYHKPTDKEAFLLGDMLHSLLLEPDDFDKHYFMMPKVNRTTKAGKLAYEEALDKAEGRQLFTPDQWEVVNGMYLALKEQKIVNQLTSGDVKFEHSIYWNDSETGLLCKARPDLWNLPLCADLKSTSDASYRAFQSSAMKYGYFVQAGMIYEAMKSIGTPLEQFLFMCVENKKPHAVGLYLLDDEALQFGIDLFHQLLRRYADCLSKDEWPDYGVQMLMIPRYATMELENE